MSARRLKLSLILVGIALSALVLLAWTQPWFSVTLVAGPVLSVAGDVAAQALTALALSGLALAAALAIAGVFFRVVLGVLQAAIGALVVTSAVIALADPIAASARAITDATGISGVESVEAQVAAVVMTAWPVIALVLGILLVILGVAIAATARRWPATGRKYQAVRLDGDDAERTAIGDWDALSNGRDPT